MSLQGAAAGILLALCVLPASFARAQTYGVGSVLPTLAFEDQHGERHRLDESLRGVLFSRDMEAGDLIKEVLAKGGGQRLEAIRTVYIADVSGMPAIVRRMIAEPRMRRRSYPMLLDRDGSLTREFPSEKGKVTVLRLEGLRVVQIHHLETARELELALRRLAPPPPEEGER